MGTERIPVGVNDVALQPARGVSSWTMEAPSTMAIADRAQQIVRTFQWFELGLSFLALVVILVAAGFGALLPENPGLLLQLWTAFSAGVLALVALGLLMQCTAWFYRGVRNVTMRTMARRMTNALAQLVPLSPSDPTGSGRTLLSWNSPWAGAAVLDVPHRVLAMRGDSTRYRVLGIPFSHVVGARVRYDDEVQTTTKESGSFFFGGGSRRFFGGYATGRSAKSKSVAVQRATLEVQYVEARGAVPLTVALPFFENTSDADRWMTSLRMHIPQLQHLG